MIDPPPGCRERLLFYGEPGTGKSRAYVDMFDNTDGTFFILDTDIAVERMWADRDTSRLVHAPAADYVEAARGMKTFEDEAGPGDWLIVDMISPTWAWCQDYWAQRRLGIDADLMSTFIPDSTDGIDYNWVEINRMYNRFLLTITKTQAHVLVIAEEDKITDGTWENPTDRDFKHMKLKPRGNKRIPHLFHSVLRCHRLTYKGADNKYMMTSAKERVGRECDWADEDMTDLSFVEEYMIPVAGWTERQPRRRRKA